MGEIIKLDEESEKFIDVLKNWRSESKCIASTEELFKYVEHLMNDYEHDYGTVVRATACIAVASANMCCNVFGLTGFQASCVMWDFLKGFMFESNKCGLKIIDFDDMLYPQHEFRFEKTISKETMNCLQKEAINRIESEQPAHPEVVNHWKKIAKGIPPFGYEVKG